MSDFQQLLAELNAAAAEEETLAKSMSADDGADDETIEAAAEEGDDTESDDDIDAEGIDDEAEGDPKFAKSMTVDGEEVQFVDAEQLIKSIGDLTERVGNHEGVLAKALETTLSTIKSQSEMIKSLSAKVDKLAGQGSGRKAVLTVHEKAPAGEQMAKSHGSDALSADEFFAKAEDKFANKMISGKDLTVIDVCRREGRLHDLDKGLVAKVLS